MSPTIDLQVGASTDDCYVSVTNTSTPPHVWTSSNLTDIVLLFGELGTLRYGAGMRFTGVTIRRSDTIDVAYLTMLPLSTESGVVIYSNIYGEDADNAATYSTVEDFNGRAKTAAVVADGLGTWTLLTPVNSPSIVAPVTTIKDRAGWVSGNAMAFEWEDDGSDNESFRRAYTWDNDSTKAPKFHVEYTEDEDSGSGFLALILG